MRPARRWPTASPCDPACRRHETRRASGPRESRCFRRRSRSRDTCPPPAAGAALHRPGPARSPITIAATIAAERGLHGPTARAIARREAARTAAVASSTHEPLAISFDQCPALHRADQRRPASGQRALGVGDIRIEIPRRTMKLQRQRARGDRRAIRPHARRRASRRRWPERRPRRARPTQPKDRAHVPNRVTAPPWFDGIDVEADGHARWRHGGIGPQRAPTTTATLRRLRAGACLPVRPVARSRRASSSNASRSDGRHASCHACSGKQHAPDQKPAADGADHAGCVRGAPRPHAADGRGQQERNADAKWKLGKEQPENRAGNQTGGRDRSDGAHASGDATSVAASIMAVRRHEAVAR